MSENGLIKEIIGLKRLRKKGFGEKSLFDLLMDFRESGYESLSYFLTGKREKYRFSDDEIEYISSKDTDIDRILSVCSDLGIKISTLCDRNYPSVFAGLRILPVFFYRGDLSVADNRNIAVVGTRSPTNYGIEMTERFVEIIAKSANIVSGGATGIDTVAHSSALKNHGKTIAFLGTPIDKPYPAVNIPLFEKIVDSGGLIISAYGPLEETNEYTFVRRNQYIAEISQAVLVIEGSEKSGAGLTAEYAFRKSVPVFALPGPVNSEKSYCPNYLISRGAKIIYSEKVILDFLGLNEGIDRNEKTEGITEKNMTDDELLIFNIIAQSKELHIDDIFVKSHKNPGEINELLLKMEIKGIIEQLPGKIYRKRSY